MSSLFTLLLVSRESIPHESERVNYKVQRSKLLVDFSGYLFSVSTLFTLTSTTCAVGKRTILLASAISA